MNNTDSENGYLAAIAKALAYLCVTSSDLKESSLAEKAKFLRSLGFPDKDVAALLNTSENTIRVQISLSKKSKKKLSPKSNPKEEQ